VIYFAQNEETCHIKIGFTAKEPELRLRGLQTGSPSLIVLLLVIDGNEKLESQLHEQFAPYRVRGEWFKPGRTLLQFMAQHWRFQIANDDEAEIAGKLVQLVKDDGPLAFSLRGPNSVYIDGMVKDMARRLFDRHGHDALERVFQAVETFAYRELNELAATAVCGSLDHRFDSIGGWYA
jgi:Meiotically up-regulated gene 113